MSRLRHHRPEIVFVLVATLVLATGWLYPLLPALLGALAWVTAARPTRTSLAALCAALLVPAPFVSTVDRAVLIALLSCLVWGAMAGLRWRRSQVLRETRSRLDAEAYRAVVEERLRIARDLHDLVAHGLSAMTIQAGYGALTTADNSPAHEKFQAIHESGRETLGQVRQMLGVLRNDGVPWQPSPRLEDLSGLVAATERAGLPVQARLELMDASVPLEVAGCIYRVVQEGLSNAIRHSNASRATVSVTTEDSELVVVVHDDGSHQQPASGELDPGSTGHGLLGLRERVSSCHGHLEAGPDAAGGYRLEVRLPAVAAATEPS